MERGQETEADTQYNPDQKKSNEEKSSDDEDGSAEATVTFKWVEGLPFLYNPNITMNEGLVVFRGLCPFTICHVVYMSKL